MSKLTAKIIAFIFNPLVILIPVPYFLVNESGGNPRYSLEWMLVSFVYIFIFFLFILFGMKVGFFSDLDVSKRKERFLLFSFAILLTILYLLILYLFRAPEILFIGAFSVAIGLSIVEIVNRYIKASIHTATLSALFTGLVLAENWLFLLGFILIPVIAWSRIKTKNHTPKETFVGFVLGVVIMVLIYSLFRYIV